MPGANPDEESTGSTPENTMNSNRLKECFLVALAFSLLLAVTRPVTLSDTPYYAFNIAEHLGKSLKKELEKLYERVHKHFGKEGGLLDVVWHGIQVQFLATHDHFESLIKRCYKETSDIHLQFTKDNLCEFFADISQSQRK